VVNCFEHWFFLECRPNDVSFCLTKI